MGFRDIATAVLMMQWLGCGVVVNGRTQRVQVETNPPGARVMLAGQEVVTPATVTVQRRDAWLVARAEKEGYAPTCRPLWARANRLYVVLDSFMAGIPLSIDVATGGFREFPDPVVLTLNPLDSERTLRTFPSDEEILAKFQMGAPQPCQGQTRPSDEPHQYDRSNNSPEGAYEPKREPEPFPPPLPTLYSRAPEPPHVVSGPTFRGVEFGYDVRKQLPSCSAAAGGRTYAIGNDGKTCWAGSSFCLLAGSGCNDPASILFADNLVGIVGHEASIEMLGDGLASMTFRIPVSSFGDIATLFQAKYGKPAVSKEEQWQSKGGVDTKAQVRFWKWKGLQLLLRAPHDDVDHGIVIVKTDEYARLQDKAHTQQLLKGLGDL